MSLFSFLIDFYREHNIEFKNKSTVFFQYFGPNQTNQLWDESRHIYFEEVLWMWLYTKALYHLTYWFFYFRFSNFTCFWNVFLFLFSFNWFQLIKLIYFSVILNNFSTPLVIFFWLVSRLNLSLQVKVLILFQFNFN